MPLHPFEGKSPDIAADAWVAPGAQVIGDVAIGAGSSVWYNCVLRGDIMPIRIGARSNLQDGTIVHVTGGRFATTIGDDVLVGHMAIVHGCTLMDRSFVGLGAIVMDGCTIAPDGMLAAGALLTPGKRIESGELWTGRPARFARRLSDEEIEGHRRGTAAYAELAARHRRSQGPSQE
jgi:carbonic anhydrase/acetyltransferase-like protein (isoleucine patch superfamily)